MISGKLTVPLLVQGLIREWRSSALAEMTTTYKLAVREFSETRVLREAFGTMVSVWVYPSAFRLNLRRTEQK